MMENYKNFKDGKQKEYYSRTKDFLLSNKKILINPGGMGLGKTWATIKALKESKIEFSFISCPTAPAKSIWANDLNKSKLNGEYAIWFSKSSCCIRKRNNEKGFDLNKHCRDDCKYWKNIQKNGDYTSKAHEELENLDKLLPTFPENYYNFIGCNNCLMPISRLGLKKRKYLIGDYFGFLNSGMFNAVINSNHKLNKNRKKGTLVIDEAHLIPERAKDFLSKTLNFTKVIEKLTEEIQCDFINRNPRLINPWKQTIIKLEVIHSELERRNKKNEERFNYNDFYDIYEEIEIKESFTFEAFLNNLRLLAKEQYKVDTNEDYEESDEPFCSKILRFIEEWQIKINDPKYRHYFQYKNFSKGKIRFIIDCCDTSEYISQRFKEWDKIILASGTIPDIEYFNYQTGINQFKLLIDYKKHIDSYSIKENVIIYSNGNFSSTNREDTYKKNKETINKLIYNLNGRTIIYIQNKYNSRLLKSLIETDKEIIDFCSKDDGFSTSQEDWMKLESKFNQSTNSIAIMNINGRVEGFNFKQEETGDSVDNIIVFGYPWARRGLSYDDQINFYTNLIKDKKIARRWVDYTPILIRIHQACCRSKRNETDNPKIILWDVQFGSLAYEYMPNDLKGNICYKSDELYLFLEKLKKEDKNVRNL